jgi:hypothetical protein
MATHQDAKACGKKLPPKTVSVGNRTYSLHLVDDPRTDDGAKVYGYMQSVSCRIVLEKGMPPAKMAETLVHELLHCALVDYMFVGMKEEKGEEFYVQVGSVGLTKIFKDNPKLFKWWLYLMSAGER